MDTLTKFDDDLFISYAHIDNEPLAEGLKGWVETFHERLRVRLEQIAGRGVRIWRDRKLSGNDEFGPMIIARLSNSAVLVAVVSPRYVDSDWCKREVAEFCERAKSSPTGLNVGGKLRVFKVVKFHVPLESHPKELQGSLGYEFFVRDAETGRVREFRPDVTPERDMRYWEKLDDLAYDIKQMLDALASGSEPPTGKTVYLSETTSDIAGERDLIKRELQLKGHVVLPDRELPLDGPRLREALREYMGRSTFSVHLLGSNYSITPEAEKLSLSEIQSEVAEQQGEALRRIVWMPAGIVPSDERQRELITKFQRGLNGHRNVEVLQTSLEELKKHLEERLGGPKPAPAEEAETAGPPGVYLICDGEDLTEVQPLAKYLFSRGLNVFLPAMGGDETEIREDHKATLIECDAALVYYGRGSDVWLRQKQRELQKVAGYGRARPMLAKAIYVSDPHTPAKDFVMDQEAKVITGFGGFSPDALAPFMEKLGKGAGQ